MLINKVSKTFGKKSSLKSNSKSISIYYLLLSTLGGFAGFSFSALMSTELSCPFLLMDEQFYYFCVTSHGVFMVFYFLTVLASSFSSYLFPDLCFFNDVNFSKFNFMAFSFLMVSMVVVSISNFFTNGAMEGWTFYVPLSVNCSGMAVDFMVMGVYTFSLYSMTGSVSNINASSLFSSVLNTFLTLPVFVWSYMLTSFLFLLAMPALSCSLGMLFMESNFNTYFFDFEFGGDSMLYQTLFWLWGHAEVYALILPVFGVMTYVLQFLCGGFTYNKSGIMCSMMTISILSFFVWGHHMTLGGFSFEVKNYFMVGTMVMGIPTGVKLFSWVFSVFLCGKGFSISLGFLISFLISFSVGGITGIFLSGSVLDNLFHDGYFVVGHFHFQLALASIFGFLSGFFFFYSAIFNMGGNLWYLGVIFYSLFIVMSFQLFSPFHLIGVLGLPSSMVVYSYEYFLLFYITSLGFIGVWISILIFMFYILSVLVIFDNKFKKW